MDDKKYTELTGLAKIRIVVAKDIYDCILEQDKDNPNGAKVGTITGMILDEVFRQGLIPNLVSSARNQKWNKRK